MGIKYLDNGVTPVSPVPQGKIRYIDEPVKNQRGVIGKAWDALAIPEKKSREGLEMIAKALPDAGQSESVALNFAKGTPKVIAETLAEAAPGFISRGSILTAGTLRGAKAAKPIIKKGGGLIAKAAESISGLEYKTPGVLKEAAKDPTLIFSKGRKAVGELYEKIADSSKIRPIFNKPMSNETLVEKALKFAGSKKNKLTPQEALIARKSLDAIKKKISEPGFRKTREIFDNIAKTLSKDADKAFSRAVKADALRLILPVNKSGGTSIAKGVLGTVAGIVPSLAMSPMVQGGVATGLGAGARFANLLAKTPIKSGAAIGGLSEAYKNRKDKGKYDKR